MNPWLCEECHAEVVGKIRRGRCEKCYRILLAQLKESGNYTKSRRPNYLTTQRGDDRSEPGQIPLDEVLQRIFRQTTPGPDGCIIFTGWKDRDGYGRIKLSGRTIRVHRKVYLLLVGEIPTGLMLDHLCHTSDAACTGGSDCRHRRCVNPRHLEPVTPAENNDRGLSLSAANGRKTHCIRGHELAGDNLRLAKATRADGKPQRGCRACNRMWTERCRKKAS